MCEAAGMKGSRCKLSKCLLDGRKDPRFVHQFGKRYLASPDPRILGPCHDDKGIFKKKFEIEWVLDSRSPNPCDQEIDFAIAQFLINDFGLRNYDVNNDARKAPRDPIDDGGHESRG